MPPFFLVADDQHTRERSESSPAAVHSMGNGRRACGEHFRDPTGAFACSGVVPGEQIILEWANALKRLSSAWQATE